MEWLAALWKVAVALADVAGSGSNSCNLQASNNWQACSPTHMTPYLSASPPPPPNSLTHPPHTCCSPTQPPPPLVPRRSWPTRRS
jgi:hypothetical protein